MSKVLGYIKITSGLLASEEGTSEVQAKLLKEVVDLIEDAFLERGIRAELVNREHR
jgi:predicted Zn-dependent protease